MAWLLALLVSGTIAYGPADVPKIPSLRPAPAADALLAGPARRVRFYERRIADLLANGARRSRTFADLVSRIHDTDLIVYVEAVHHLPPETYGRLLLQAVAGGQRYLRVQVRATLPGDTMIALIAHELRHALEIADEPAVVDEASLSRLYKRIGLPSAGVHGYDTEAARATGIRVRDELIG